MTVTVTGVVIIHVKLKLIPFYCQKALTDADRLGKGDEEKGL